MDKKNLILFYLQSAAYSAVNLIAVGTIFQTFMLESDIDEAKVSFCVTAFQVIQTLTMLLISKAAENIKSVLQVVGIGYLAYSILIASMLFICFKTNISVNSKFAILFITGSVVSLFIGLINILSYKMPHHIMDIKDYGRATGQSGVISGVLGIVITSLMTLALNKFDFFKTMTVVCVFGICLSCIAGRISFIYYPLNINQKTQKYENINIFRYKPFYQLLVPNFMRGFSTGIFNLVAVIGYHSNVLDGASAALLITISQISTLLGSQSYSFFAKKQKNGLLCLISSVVMLISTPLMLLGGTKTVFIIFYFISFLFVNYINIAVPVVVAEYIDYNCLGQYTAWRMALFTLGVSLGGFVVPLLLNSIGGFGTLLVSGITMLPCGIGYYIFEKNKRKNTI